MVDAALAAGRMFGMIQPRGRGGALERVGCLGRLSSFAETDDGCYLITLTGIARFTVAEELALRHGYRSVRADFSGFADLGAAPPVVLDRDALLGALRRYFGTRGLDANWDALAQIDDDMLVTTLSMVCPFSDVEKQALLEAVDQTERLGKLLALLAIGSHEGNGGTRHAS